MPRNAPPQVTPESSSRTAKLLAEQEKLRGLIEDEYEPSEQASATAQTLATATDEKAVVASHNTGTPRQIGFRNSITDEFKDFDDQDDDGEEDDDDEGTDVERDEGDEDKLEHLIEQILEGRIDRVVIPESFTYRDIEEVLEVLQDNTTVRILDFNGNAALRAEFFKRDGLTRFLASFKDLLEANESLAKIQMRDLDWDKAIGPIRDIKPFLQKNDSRILTPEKVQAAQKLESKQSASFTASKVLAPTAVHEPSLSVKKDRAYSRKGINKRPPPVVTDRRIDSGIIPPPIVYKPAIPTQSTVSAIQGSSAAASSQLTLSAQERSRVIAAKELVAMTKSRVDGSDAKEGAIPLKLPSKPAVSVGIPPHRHICNIPTGCKLDKLFETLRLYAKETTLTDLTINFSEGIQQAINTGRFKEIIQLLNAVIDNNKRLTYLGLRGNNLHAVAHLLPQLQVGALETIDLASNDFGKLTSESRAVVAAINKFAALKFIDISDNEIHTSLAIDIVTELQKSKSNARVNLSKNPLTYNLTEVAVNGDKDICVCLAKAMASPPGPYMSFILDDICTNTRATKDFGPFSRFVNTTKNFLQSYSNIQAGIVNQSHADLRESYKIALFVAINEKWQIINRNVMQNKYETRNKGVANALAEIRSAKNLQAFITGLINLREALSTMHDSVYYVFANATTYKKINRLINDVNHFIKIYIAANVQTSFTDFSLSKIALSVSPEPTVKRANVTAPQEVRAQRAEAKM